MNINWYIYNRRINQNYLRERKVVVRSRIISSASSLCKGWLEANIWQLSMTHAISTCAVRGSRHSNFHRHSRTAYITKAFWNWFHRVGAAMKKCIEMTTRNASKFSGWSQLLRWLLTSTESAILETERSACFHLLQMLRHFLLKISCRICRHSTCFYWL